MLNILRTYRGYAILLMLFALCVYVSWRWHQAETLLHEHRAQVGTLRAAVDKSKSARKIRKLEKQLKSKKSTLKRAEKLLENVNAVPELRSRAAMQENDVVATSLFFKLGEDLHKRKNNGRNFTVSYVIRWLKSAHKLGLKALILHDGCVSRAQRDEMIQVHRSLRVVDVSRDADSDECAMRVARNDRRFCVLRRFLERDGLRDAMLVHTDASDVVFARNPFNLALRRYDAELFVGNDHASLISTFHRRRWRKCYASKPPIVPQRGVHVDANDTDDMSSSMVEQLLSFAFEPARQGDADANERLPPADARYRAHSMLAYNAGILGGARSSLIKFLRHIEEELSRAPLDQNCNMAALNAALIANYNRTQIFTGAPLQSVFLAKQSSKTSYSAILHK
jgi:hypothetical protein